MGSKGHEKIEIFSDESKAVQALDNWAGSQRRKGYTDL
ncbi:hypothetical protein [Microvirga vignae]